MKFIRALRYSAQAARLERIDPARVQKWDIQHGEPIRAARQYVIEKALTAIAIIVFFAFVLFGCRWLGGIQ